MAGKLAGVITFFATFALLNFLLGFALAVFLEEPQANLRAARAWLERRDVQCRALLARFGPRTPWRLPRRLPLRIRERFWPTPADDLDDMQPEEQGAKFEPLPLDESGVPVTWREQLASAGISVPGLLPNALALLLVRLGELHNELLAREAQLRDDEPGRTATALAAQLAELAEQWLQQQECLLANLERLVADAEQPTAAELKDTLLDTATHWNAALTGLQLLEPDDDDEAGEQAEYLLPALGELLRCLHLTRDQLHLWLTVVDGPQFDARALPVPGPRLEMPSLLDAASLLEAWSAHEDESRLATMAVLRVDRFGLVNEQLGSPLADQLIRCLGELLSGELRSQRGADQLVHLDGPAFALFCGDTALHNGASGADRLRQAIEATTFRHAAGAVQLTATAVVRELRRGDRSLPFFRRLQSVLEQAVREGGNCTRVDEGAAIVAFHRPRHAVPARELPIEELTAAVP